MNIPGRDSSAQYFTAITLMLAGVCRFPCDDLRLSLVFLSNMAAALLLAALLWIKINKWVAVFLVSATLSSFLPVYSQLSFVAFHNMLMMVIWYAALVLLLDKQGFSIVMDAICIIALVHIAFQVMQSFRIFYLIVPVAAKWNDVTFAPGLMANRNETSALLALCAPAFLRPRRWPGLIAICYGLVKAKTTMGVLSIAAAMFFFLAPGAPWMRIIFMIVGFGILFSLWIIFIDSPGFERLVAWKHGWLDLYPARPITGHGLGHWPAIYRWPGWRRAHNEYLQGLVEMGPAFLVLCAGYLIDICKRYRDSAIIFAAALIAILVNCSANFLFHIGTTAIIATTWLAGLEMHLRGDS